MEWRYIKGQPDRLAGMITRLTASEGANAEATTSYLVVTKVTPGEVCVVGKVPKAFPLCFTVYRIYVDS